MTLVDDIYVIAPVARIWIEAGCIQCGWCSDLVPDVFLVTGDALCEIRGQARVDHLTDDNRTSRILLVKPFEGAEATFIEFVAAGCPAAVIRIDG